MVILHVTGMTSNKYGGLERFFLSQMLANPEDHFILAYNSYPKSKEFVDNVESAGGIINILNTDRKNILLNTGKFISVCRKNKVDVVHFHFQDSYLLWGVVAWLIGVRKRVKYYHSCITTKDFQQIWSKEQLSWKFNFLTLSGRILSLFTDIICVSTYIKRQLLSVYPFLQNSKVKVSDIYLGTSLPQVFSEFDCNNLRRELGIKLDEIIVSTILFAVPMKGVDVFIKAMKYVTAINVRFLIIGTNEDLEYTKEMHRLAKENNVEDKIIWIGITDDVPKYLSISDIYVQPSRTEALGLAAVEAISYGLPTVASNVGGLPEVTDLLFPVGDYKECSKILNNLITDSAYRTSCSNKALKHYYSTFTIAKGISNHHKIYES